MALYLINDTGYRLWLAGSEAIQKGGSIFAMSGGEPKRLPLEPADVSVSPAMTKAGIAALGQEGVDGLLTRIYQAMQAARSKEAFGQSDNHGDAYEPLIDVSLTEKYCRYVDEAVLACHSETPRGNDAPSADPGTSQ